MWAIKILDGEEEEEEKEGNEHILLSLLIVRGSNYGTSIQWIWYEAIKKIEVAVHI